MTTRRDDSGFTLLEVLVALAIAALALGILLQGTVAGLAAAQRAGLYEEALERARSHMAALASSGALSPLDEAGDDGGGYRWRHRVAVLRSETVGSGETGGPRSTDAVVTLYAVSVAITYATEDGRESGVTLDTERLGLAPRVGP